MVEVIGNQSEFSAGEVSDTYHSDHGRQVRNSGAQTIENGIITTSGSIKKRPGSRYMTKITANSILGQIVFDDYLLIFANFPDRIVDDVDEQPPVRPPTAPVTPGSIIIYKINRQEGGDSSVLAATFNLDVRIKVESTIPGHIPAHRIGNSIFFLHDEGIIRLLFVPGTTGAALGTWTISEYSSLITRAYVDDSFPLPTIPFTGNVGTQSIAVSSIPGLLAGDAGRRFLLPGFGTGTISGISAAPNSAAKFVFDEVPSRGESPIQPVPALPGTVSVSGGALTSMGILGLRKPFTDENRDFKLLSSTVLLITVQDFWRDYMVGYTVEPVLGGLYIINRRQNGSIVECSMIEPTLAEGNPNWLLPEAYGNLPAMNLARSTNFLVDDLTTSFSMRKPSWSPKVFTSYNNWPRIISYHQDRLILASNYESRNKLWFSGTGDYFNFLIEGTGEESFSVTLDPEDHITWIVSAEVLFVGTTRGVYSISQDAIFSSETISIKKISSQGSRLHSAVTLGSQIFFLDNLESNIHILYFNRELNTYVTRNVTAQISHLFGTDVEAIRIVSLTVFGQNLIAVTQLKYFRASSYVLYGPLLYGTILPDREAIGWTKWPCIYSNLSNLPIKLENPASYSTLSSSLWPIIRPYGAYERAVYMPTFAKVYFIKRYHLNLILEEMSFDSYMDMEVPYYINTATSTTIESQNITLNASLNHYPGGIYLVEGTNGYKISNPALMTVSSAIATGLGFTSTITEKTVLLGLSFNLKITFQEPEIPQGNSYLQGTGKVFNELKVLVNQSVPITINGLQSEGFNALKQSMKTYYVGIIATKRTVAAEFKSLSVSSGYYKFVNPQSASYLGQLTILTTNSNQIAYGPIEVSGIYYRISVGEE